MRRGIEGAGTPEPTGPIADAMRQLDFTPTPAVQSARRRAQYIACPACGSESQRYLFHRTGIRFVRCRACDVVYADAIDPAETVDVVGGSALGEQSGVDRRNARANFADMVERIVSAYQRRFARPPRKVLLIGQWDLGLASAYSGTTRIVVASDVVEDAGQLAARPLIETLGARLGDFDVLLLHHLVEVVHQPAQLLEGLSDRLHREAVVAVAFTNMRALLSRTVRRRSKRFYSHKVAFYDAANLEQMMWRLGFSRIDNERLTRAYSLDYLAERLDVAPRLRRGLARSRLARLTVRVASGRDVILFQPAALTTVERLSIIMPVYNEERYVGDVLRALLRKELPVDREIIIVESNSKDRSREIVGSFEGEPGVQVIYQDKAQGKGNAVRAGLERATGTIVLVQDADFEYDIDDYDALLEPILQRRTAFVLGSRSLGLDDWKVRQYARSRVKGFLMNFAQVVFARTFNVLYQQRVTDINTMLKVFRRECIQGCDLTGNGFNFDIELVCKIVRNGFSPFEVPVNYVARSFDEGKKINFLLDAYPSYFQLFRCRLGRP
jgi:hypothetical protein